MSEREAAPPPSSSEPTTDERNLATIAHLLGILLSFLGALVVWLIKKDSSPFVAHQAKEALNFQITMLLAAVVAALTCFTPLGPVLAPLVWAGNVVFCILAAVSASQGQRYRYPVALRLIS